MAMSGNFESSFASGYRIGVDWRVTSQSTSSNSSNITADVYLRSTGGSYTINSSANKTVSINIDGQTFTKTDAKIGLSGNQKKVLFTASKTVYHDSNGNKSLGISGSADIKITFGSGYVGTVSASSTVTLDKINLNSPPSLGGSAWTNISGTIPENTGNINISWNPASDAQNNVRGYRVYRYVNGGHNGTLWPGGNSVTDNIGGFGEGTSIYYKIWAYDAFDAYSGEINSNTVTKNTLTGGSYTGHSNDINFNTTSFTLYFSGGRNSNGGTVRYQNFSDEIEIHGQYSTTEGSQTISIWKSGSYPSGLYIKFEDLKNKFKNSNYNGRLSFKLKTFNDYGSEKWAGGSVGVDLRTDITVAGGSTSINNNSYYSIAGTNYLIPGRKQITLNWPQASDPLGTTISYRVEQNINNGGWGTLLNSTNALSYAFNMNVSGKPSYKFRVVARNGYGWEKVISGEPSGIMYNYNAPSVSITGTTRTSDKLNVTIATSVSTEIPGNGIRSLKWSFGSKNGTLATNATSFDITGLSQTDSGTFSIMIEDTHGSAVGQGTITINGSIPQFFPMLSVRRNGVGINTTPDSDVKLTVRGGLKVDGKIITKVVDEGAYRYGKQGAIDENFRRGMNNIGVYDNTGGGKVTLTRIDDLTAPNASKKVIKISNTGTASPGHGGFSWAHSSYASGQWNYILVAKIPADKEIRFHNNAFGEGATFDWISDNKGTGDWYTYIGTAKAGKTGSFSSIGYFAVVGGSTGFDWYLAKATYFDITHATSVPFVDGDGVMEVGQYMDFHQNDITNDYDARIEIAGSSNGSNASSHVIVRSKLFTAGNSAEHFKMGRDLGTDDSGMASSKANMCLSGGRALWLKANNYYDGANDVHYDRNAGASQILLETNQYPRYRWSDRGENSFGVAQWSGWRTFLTNDEGQQVVMGRGELTDGANWNNFENNGVYLVSCGNNWGANYPPNSYPWGNLLVVRSSNTVSQVYFPHSGSHYFQYRTRWGDGTWTQWANPGWSAYSLNNQEAVSVLNSDAVTLDLPEYRSSLRSTARETLIDDDLLARDLHQALKQVMTLSNDSMIGLSKESVLELDEKVKKVLVDKISEQKRTYDGEEVIIPASEQIKTGVEGIWSLVALQEEIKIREGQYQILKEENQTLRDELTLIKARLDSLETI